MRYTSSSLTIDTIYTVPSAEGPAVIRSVAMFCGVDFETFVFISKGGVRYVLFHLDNTAGTVPIDRNEQMYLPLDPGDLIQTQCVASGGGNEADILVGGYQFMGP